METILLMVMASCLGGLLCVGIVAANDSKTAEKVLTKLLPQQEAEYDLLYPKFTQDEIIILNSIEGGTYGSNGVHGPLGSVSRPGL